MNVILDTNIYVQDFLMNSVSFGLLLDYLNKTGSKIIMPQIVCQELAEKYRADLSLRLSQFDRAKESLEKALTEAPPVPHLEVDVGRETAKYLDFVRRKLKLRDKDIIPFRDGYLGELVTRAITRAKPFSDRGEEFRDALLWLTVLDVARETSDETLAFISADAKAFGQNHQLHEPLLQEGQATGKQINFYNSIGKFIESHATHIEYITQHWLFMAIHYDSFEAAIARRLTQRLESLDEHDVRQAGWEGLTPTGHLSCSGPVTEEHLTEFYVYERADGSLYAQANFYVEYEIEFTVKVKVRKDGVFGAPFSFRSAWQTHSYDQDDDDDEIETKTIYKYQEVEIIFGVEVNDGQVGEVELSSVYL
jgi:hypothetical protein